MAKKDTMKALRDDLNAANNRIDNLTRIVRDNVKTTYGKVKQKDAEGNVTYENNVHDACERIKP